VDAIELMEWATTNLIDQDDFAETLGPLRVRAVKAAPKDKIAATRCLESCLLHWDLVSAQQVKALAFHMTLISGLAIGAGSSQDADCGHHRPLFSAGKRFLVLEYCHHPPAFCELYI
jgi:hypothetical protein